MGLGLLAAGSAVLFMPQPSPEAVAPVEPVQKVEPVRGLEPGRAYEDHIAPGEAHTFTLDTRGSDFLEVSLEQRGIDLKVTLLDTAGQPSIWGNDESLGESGTESLPALIEISGSYQLKIEPTNDYGNPGWYSVSIAVRQPSERERLQVAAVRELNRGGLLEEDGSFAEAQAAFQRAFESAEQAKAARLAVQALYRKGLAFYNARQYEQARDVLHLAVQRYRDQGIPLGEAHALNWEGATLYNLHDLEGAMSNRQAALKLFEDVGGLVGALWRSRVYRSMAATHHTWGEYRSAKDLYQKALSTWPPGGEEMVRIQTLVDLGNLHSTLADFDQARNKLQEALDHIKPLSLDADLACEKARALSLMGQTYIQERQTSKALSYIQWALRLSNRCEDERVFNLIALQIGEVYLERPAKGLNRYLARLAFQKAYDRSRARRDDGNAMNALTGLAGLHVLEGNPEKGKELFDEALALRQKRGYQLGIVGALFGRAQAERALGDLEAAQRSIASSLEAIEELRRGPQAEMQSASLFASRRENYDLSISIWMEQHEHARAFEVNERARGRTLLDWLTGELLAEGEEQSPGSTDAQRESSGELRTLLRKRVQLSRAVDENPTEEGKKQIEALNGTILDILSDLAAVRAERRVLNLEDSEPMTLQEIQEQVLDEKTLLLAYWFSEDGEGSYLWAVESDSITVHSFAPGAKETIEKLTARVNERLNNPASDAQETLGYLSNLSELILSPVASRIEGRRLLIVADGALQSLPFPVLQDPAALSRARPGQVRRGWEGYLPLGERHAVVMLPSASMLGVLRRELADRAEAPRDLAILYDPVFRLDDERAPGGEQRGEDASEVRSPVFDRELHNLKRLDSTKLEAEAILRMVDPEKSFSATGFEANLDVAQSPVLGQHKIVHFATHGILDPQPELSRLALSAFHKNGLPRNGFLRAYEISLLQLPVELVVLSACETGVGKPVPGEGVFNLSRAFFYAGARRVVVTYWSVDDEATAEFMTFFYKSMLEDGLDTSEALREAQKQMRKRDRAHPYYWGGFVLQGEW